MLICHLFENIDLDKTVAKYGKALIDKAIYDSTSPVYVRLDLDGRNFVQYFIDADPSIHKSYVQWIIRTYLSGGIRRFEDLSRTTDALILYDRFKRRLPLDQRDINKIKSLPDLEGVVAQFEDKKTGKELKKDELAKIKDDTIIVYDGPEGKIIIPKTQEASCFWGQQTKWCTAGNKDNYFASYNRQGPLYIILPTDGEKFQFHFETGSLMDASDRQVVLESFDAKYPWVFDNINISEEVQKDSIKLDPDAIMWIKYPSIEIQKYAVSLDGRDIKYLKNPSEEIQILAVQNEGSAIKFIKNPSEKIKQASVQHDGSSIRFIENPSDQVKKLAVKKNGSNIQYIADPSPLLQLLAVKQNPRSIIYIEKPSENLQLAAIKEDAGLVAYISNPTERVQKIAVTKDGRLIEYIKNPSEEIQRLAIIETPLAFKHIKNPSDAIKQLFVDELNKRFGPQK